MDDSLWAEKTRQLDDYRWQVLRARHSLTGAFFRYCKEFIFDFYYGIRAKRIIRNAEVLLVKGPVELLLLHASPKVMALKRKRTLTDRWKKDKVKFAELALTTPKNILNFKQIAQPKHKVSVRYFIYAAYAQWITDCYCPKLIINDRNGSLFSSFLRLALHDRQGFLVHLAHATTVERSRRLAMNDYDYYLLFGQSSLDSLIKRKLTFGRSTVILSGSYLVDSSYRMTLNSANEKIILLLGVGPDKEKELDYKRTYKLIAGWAIEHPEYRLLIKLHPRSKRVFWKEFAAQFPHVELLESTYPLANALKRSSIVINIMSNAVIEASLASRPIIYCYLGQDVDVLEQSRYFSGPVSTLEQLQIQVELIEKNYEQHTQIAQSFSLHHLAHGTCGSRVVNNILYRLMRDEPLSNELTAVNFVGSLSKGE